MIEAYSHDEKIELSGRDIAFSLGEKYLEYTDARHSAQKVASRMVKEGILNERRDISGHLWYSISESEINK